MTGKIDKPIVDYTQRRFIWGTDKTEPRFLHLALRVQSLDRSISFYVEGLGMKLMDRISLSPGKLTAAFVGYDDYDRGGMIELCELWDDNGPYTQGTGFGHISIGTGNVDAAVEKLEAMGAEVTAPPRDYDGEGPRLAYIKDPDGYSIELIQTVR
jgi:lactoylglutathione lyase